MAAPRSRKMKRRPHPGELREEQGSPTRSDQGSNVFEARLAVDYAGILKALLLLEYDIIDEKNPRGRGIYKETNE